MNLLIFLNTLEFLHNFFANLKLPFLKKIRCFKRETVSLIKLRVLVKFSSAVCNLVKKGYPKLVMFRSFSKYLKNFQERKQN